MLLCLLAVGGERCWRRRGAKVFGELVAGRCGVSVRRVVNRRYSLSDPSYSNNTTAMQLLTWDAARPEELDRRHMLPSSLPESFGSCEHLR